MCASDSGGYALVEVIVAVLLLALGVVGATRMHATAMRTRHESGLSTQALRIANDLADRMRANVAQLQQADALNAYLGAHFDATLDPAPAPPAASCADVPCDAGQLAQFDLFETEEALSANLPGARLLVCRDGQAWDAAGRTLAWTCSAAGDAPIVIKIGWRVIDADGGGGVGGDGGSGDGGAGHGSDGGSAARSGKPVAPGIVVALEGAGK